MSAVCQFKWTIAGRTEWRRWGSAHPEWWSLGICAIAWGFLLRPSDRLASELCGVASPPSSAGILVVGVDRVLHWSVMIVAMMLPLVVYPVREVAFASLWRRRHWSIAVFLASYLTIWVAAGLVLMMLPFVALRQLPLPAGSIGGAAFAFAAVWQLSQIKRRASVACHWTRPLAPLGWSALRDLWSYGSYQGWYCVVNCGPIMLASLLSRWRIPAMIAATLLLSYERYRPRPNRRALPVALGLIALAHGVYG